MRRLMRVLAVAITIAVAAGGQTFAEKLSDMLGDERIEALRNLPLGSVCDLKEVYPRQWDCVDIVNGPLEVAYFYDAEWEEYHAGLSEAFRLSDTLSGLIFRNDGRIVNVVAYESRTAGAPLFRPYERSVDMDICRYERTAAVFTAVRQGDNGEIVLLPLNMSDSAGEKEYFTTDEDKYYHTDIACDKGKKFPLSEEAALLFGKSACPLCVKGTQPVYTGDCAFEWTFEGKPWMLNTADFELRQRVRNSVPEAFREESWETEAQFDALYINDDTGEQKQTFPEDYAGRYLNAAGGLTFLLVDPTPQSIAAFDAAYGGGVWIVPAKYGKEELEVIRQETIESIEQTLAG